VSLSSPIMNSTRSRAAWEWGASATTPITAGKTMPFAGSTGFATWARSAALMCSVLEGSPDPIFAKDRDGRFLLANPATLAVIGGGAGEVLGRTGAEVWPADVHAALSEADRRALAGETMVREERVPDARSGEVRTFLAARSPLRDAAGAVVGLTGVARDVTDRKVSELALRRQADEIAAIYDAAPVGLCVLDRELRCLRINERLAEINGLPAAEHIGRTVRDVVPDLDDKAAETMERILAGEAMWGVDFTGTTRAAGRGAHLA
jgi:PAS domain S-box-containing protein